MHEQAYREYVDSRSTKAGLVGPGQPKLDSFVVAGDTKTYGSVNPRQKMLINSLVGNLLVRCGLPLSIVDNTGFRKFLSDMDPKFLVPCRQTVTYSVLPTMKEAKQKKLRGLLDTCHHLAITADIWTDRRSHAFLGVTVHMFRAGKPQSQLLAFQAFGGSHTGQLIADALTSIIAEFKIRNKLRWIVTDNASNMKKAMSVLLDSFEETMANDEADPTLWEDVDNADDINSALSFAKRIPCFAHSIQLVVRDGLAALNTMRSPLAKCSKLANLVHQSPLFKSAFEASFKDRSIPATNDTRWNSTFRQLKAIINLDQPKLNTVLKGSNQDALVLTAKDVDQLQELVKILEPFAEATDLTQGENTITISCIVPVLLSLNRSIGDQSSKGGHLTGLVTKLAEGLHNRFRGIFSRLNISPPDCVKASNLARDLAFDDDIFVMASALDPVYAYHWLQDHPSSFEEKQAIRHHVDGNILQCLCVLLLKQLNYAHDICDLFPQ